MATGQARDPSSAPWLAGITIGYLIWSLAPIVLAIVYSFNAGSSVTHWKGFSLRWWVGDPAAQESIVFDPEARAALLHSLVLASCTVAIAVPCGTAFALGCQGRRTRISRLGLRAMLLTLATPPIVLGVAMWLLFPFPLRTVPFGEFGWFGTRAQIVGLVTLFLPLATLVVFARLVLIGRDQEETAAGAGIERNARTRPGDVRIDRRGDTALQRHRYDVGARGGDVVRVARGGIPRGVQWSKGLPPSGSMKAFLIDVSEYIDFTARSRSTDIRGRSCGAVEEVLRPTKQTLDLRCKH